MKIMIWAAGVILAAVTEAEVGVEAAVPIVAGRDSTLVVPAASKIAIAMGVVVVAAVGVAAEVGHSWILIERPLVP